MKDLQFTRHRRLRNSVNMRALVRETHLHPEDFIYPIFIVEGEQKRNAVKSMPGVDQISLDYLNDEIQELVDLGIKSAMVFGVPAEKDAVGSQAYHDHGIVQKGIRQIKENFPDFVVIADTCLCQYTDHGHCGVIEDVPVMSYAVKYASAFYGPFRDAAHSSPQFGDRKTYQMDPANRLEALREAESDVEEGADFLIVKPALSYLDIMRDVKNTFNLPVVAYNVSGEYSMIKAAAQNGWVNEKEIVLEKLISMKRAGADLIVTYHAKDAARWLSDK